MQYTFSLWPLPHALSVHMVDTFQNCSVLSTLLTYRTIHKSVYTSRPTKPKLIRGFWNSDYQPISPLTTKWLHINTGDCNCSGSEILFEVTWPPSWSNEEACLAHQIPLVQGGGTSSQGGRLFWQLFNPPCIVLPHLQRGRGRTRREGGVQRLPPCF